MNKSRLEVSFDRGKTSNARADSNDVNTSLRIEVTTNGAKRRTGRTVMSALESAPPHLLMKNVQDIRKRLMETEKTLNKITKAEANVENDDADIDDLISLTSNDSRHRGRYTIEDDKESIQSGLATLPDSSYAGFERVQPPSSTPNRPSIKSRLTGLLEMVEPRPEPGSPGERRHSDIEEDRQDHRAQIRFLKEANKKVLIQNQKLMNEVEKMSYELQSSRAKVRELSYELDEFRQSVPELEDRVLGLQAEAESQDKALREAEDRFESCQREVVSSERKNKELQQEIDELRKELYEERKLRKNLETQRDEALQNFIEVQDTLQDYQKKSKDRQKKYESTEDHLRDSLSHANREREELIQRLSFFQAKVKSQQEDIRKLQSIQEVEEHNKGDIEEHNNELRSQISKLTSKISRLEGDSQLLQSLQFENQQLRSQVGNQHDQLAQCQEEIEESRTMLVQLEQLAQQVQLNYSRHTSRNTSFSNDSGNFSIRQPGDMSTTATFQKSPATAAESLAAGGATGESNPSHSSANNILSELRLKLAMKDAEIQRLQQSLQSAQAQDQTSALENLRTDLDAMVEKNQKTAERCQELESAMSKLENEKERYVSQMKDLRRELSDRDSQISSFDLRITQRNSQLVDLQEQLNDKAIEVSKLERQVREKSSRITSLEEQLQDQLSQCSHQQARVKQLEGELKSTEAEAQTLHKELQERQVSANGVKEEVERVQKIHQEQCRDYQQQIDIINDRLENKINQANEWEKQTDNLRREVSEKAHALFQTEQLLTQAQQELEKNGKQNKAMLRELEGQVKEGSVKIKQLDAALNLCKDEIRTYIGALEESKEVYDREIAKRDEKIKRLERQFRTTGHELELKTSECESLQRQVLELQAMLEQGTGRIQELEDMQTDQHRQISKLEHELLSGSSQWMNDQQTMEMKLKQACEDLEQKTAQLKTLTDTLRKVEGEKKQLIAELDLMECQLREEQDDNEDKSDYVSKLERDLRDMRVQLEQKIELVTDFEDQLQQKNLDMEQQLQLVTDLDVEIKRLQDVYQESVDKVSDLEKQLDRVGYEAKAKDEMMDDMKESLRSAQEELSSRKTEVVKLRSVQEEMEQELDKRVEQVRQLDATIKQQHTEMEQRIRRLDNTLQKNETEVQERTKQIADLDDKLQQTQAELRERTLQQQQAEQLSQKLQIELNSKAAKLSEQDSLVERQKSKLEEQKEENVEITQELRLTREQLQQQHSDFMATRRELAQSHRDQERLQRDLDELRSLLENKDGDAARLAEELGASKARENEMESRIAGEVRKLSEEHDDLEAKYQSELRALREDVGDYREANDILKAQLKEKSKQLADMESHYADQINAAARELDGINEEVEAKREQMSDLTEQIILKDSEIARLKAKLASVERSLNVARMGASDGTMDIQGQGKSSKSYQSTRVQSQEIVLSDVSVTIPNSQISSHTVDFGQEVEIQFVSRCENTDNQSKSSRKGQGQENIEPSGPVRALSFTADCDDKNNYNSVIHRPKPVLPNSAPLRSKDSLPEVSSKEPKEVAGRADQKSQSAFSRISRDKGKSKDEKSFPGEKELEPVTAMRHYNPDSFNADQSDLDPEKCMRELHERLRANEQRQKDIDRQLLSLEDEEQT